MRILTQRPRIRSGARRCSGCHRQLRRWARVWRWGREGQTLRAVGGSFTATASLDWLGAMGRLFDLLGRRQPWRVANRRISASFCAPACRVDSFSRDGRHKGSAKPMRSLSTEGPQAKTRRFGDAKGRMHRLPRPRAETPCRASRSKPQSGPDRWPDTGHRRRPGAPVLPIAGQSPGRWGLE